MLHIKIKLTIARGDEVSDPARLEESAELASRVEHVDELNHLHQTEPDDGRLSVVSESEAVDETGADCYYVLYRH